MKVALLVIGGLVILVVAFVVWRYLATILGAQRRTDALMAHIMPVISSIQEGRDVPREQLVRFARRPDTRVLLYRALHELGQSDLFPEEHGSLAALAESDLVVWLLHPNELGAVPQNIELVEAVAREEGDPPERCQFFIFKFRSLPPHWAARDGWMAGVAGPYVDGKAPLCPPPRRLQSV